MRRLPKGYRATRTGQYLPSVQCNRNSGPNFCVMDGLPWSVLADWVSQSIRDPLAPLSTNSSSAAATSASNGRVLPPKWHQADQCPLSPQSMWSSCSRLNLGLFFRCQFGDFNLRMATMPRMMPGHNCTTLVDWVSPEQALLSIYPFTRLLLALSLIFEGGGRPDHRGGNTGATGMETRYCPALNSYTRPSKVLSRTLLSVVRFRRILLASRQIPGPGHKLSGHPPHPCCP